MKKHAKTEIPVKYCKNGLLDETIELNFKYLAKMLIDEIPIDELKKLFNFSIIDYRNYPGKLTTELSECIKREVILFKAEIK